MAGCDRTTQFVRIAHDVDCSDPLAVNGDGKGVIEFTVDVEQGASGAVDHRRFHANVAAAILAGKRDEETRNLVSALDRIERRRLASPVIGDGNCILTEQTRQGRSIAARDGFDEIWRKPE